MKIRSSIGRIGGFHHHHHHHGRPSLSSSSKLLLLFSFLAGSVCIVSSASDLQLQQQQTSSATTSSLLTTNSSGTTNVNRNGSQISSSTLDVVTSVPITLRIDHLLPMSMEEESSSIHWQIFLEEEEDEDEAEESDWDDDTAHYSISSSDDVGGGSSSSTSTRRQLGGKKKQQRLVASSSQVIEPPSHPDSYSTTYQLELEGNRNYWFVVDEDVFRERTSSAPMVEVYYSIYQKETAEEGQRGYPDTLLVSTDERRTTNGRTSARSSSSSSTSNIRPPLSFSTVPSLEQALQRDLQVDKNPRPTTPRPTAAPIPVVTRPNPGNGGGNGGNNGGGNSGGGDGETGGNVDTPAPTPPPVGTKPPIQTTPTSAPVTEEPSAEPTPEPECTSTVGAVTFSSAYVAIRVRFQDGKTEADLEPQDVENAFLRAITNAYNSVAECEQKGAFRNVAATAMVRSNPQGSNPNEAEYIVALRGNCKGCSDTFFRLFEVFDESTNDDVAGVVSRRRRQLQEEGEGEDDFYRAVVHPQPQELNRDLEAQPCFCIGPSIVSFVDRFNRDSPPDPIAVMAEAVEVLPTEECQLYDDEIQDEDDVVEEFTTPVLVLVSSDPSTWSPGDLEAFQDAFVEAYRYSMGLTMRVCDVSRRFIDGISVTVGEFFAPDPAERRRQRNLRDDPLWSSSLTALMGDYHHRALEGDEVFISSFNETYEILVSVDYSCQGCEGFLFGEDLRGETVLESLDCLCPEGNNRGGVTEEDFQEALNMFVAKAIPSFVSVRSVMEVEAFPCPSEQTPLVSVATVEFDLAPGVNDILRSEVIVIENAFVRAFNRVARSFCDPQHRQLVRATVDTMYTIPGSTEGVNAMALVMDVFGWCRECSRLTPVYDAESFFTDFDTDFGTRFRFRGLSEQKNVPSSRISPTSHSGFFASNNIRRNLQDETCYCGINSIKGSGPNEPSVVEFFGDVLEPVVSSSILPNVETFADCQYLTSFSTSILLSIEPNTDGETTDEQIAQLGETFVNSYNGADDDNRCDRLQRQITDFSIQTGISVDDDLLNPESQETGPNGRRMMTWSKLKRNMQDIVTEFPTSSPSVTPDANSTAMDPFFAPSQSPTSGFFDQVNIQLLLLVAGTCRGCASELGLFNQIIGGVGGGPTNRLLQDGTDSDTISDGVSGSCFCPPNADREEPTEEEIAVALGQLEFVRQAKFEEVAVVKCDIELDTFESVVRIDFYAKANALRDDDLETVVLIFMTAYNGLAPEFCDELLRRSTDCRLDDILFDQISPEDEDGISRVRFDLTCEGTCDDCNSDEPFLDEARGSRNLETDEEIDNEFCICPRNGARRAPTEQELYERLIETFEEQRRALASTTAGSESGRRLKNVGNLYGIAGVGEPEVTDEPTAAPVSNAQTIEDFQDCIVDQPQFVGDGWCDDNLPGYNTEDCGFDGGDCCSDTCVDSLFICGSGGFFCLEDDNNSGGQTDTGGGGQTNADPDGCFSGVDNPSWVGDGFCDREGGYNTAICGYDGGDCCIETCADENNNPCNPAGVFQCLDPKFASAPTEAPLVVCDVPNPMWVGDGFCDPGDVYNTPECGFDGGDCCAETCNGCAPDTDCGPDSFVCGSNGFDCADPLFFVEGACNVAVPEWLGDGFCDGGVYNIEACGWDNGDCCEQTCASTESITCGVDSGFQCLDPEFSTGGCTVSNPSWLGDGYCDLEGGYNTEECRFDGGDCCQETCVGCGVADCIAPPYFCGVNGYQCIDTCQSPNKNLRGNGNCDNELNNEDCGYDFGDCCVQSCVSTPEFTCGGGTGFNCIDPDAPGTLAPVSPAPVTPAPTPLPTPPPTIGECLAPNMTRIGDGRCDSDPAYNSIACDWDGGDCCTNSCVDNVFTCTTNNDACLDPCPVKPAEDFRGNGECDAEFNKAACGFDGGDCCAESCQGDCSSFFCQDPVFVQEECVVPDPVFLGDGYCDGDRYNNEACLFDGGDCCEESCTEDQDNRPFECGSSNRGYECRDPEFASAEPSSLPSVFPSQSPSELPSVSPSESPSGAPSESPSETPSASPSQLPSSSPSESPSSIPSASPSLSISPSEMPSDSPSESTNPSSMPSDSPSLSTSPSDSPSGSINPSSMPSDSPSESTNPSSMPSDAPSLSTSPSDSPSGSINPSSEPSMSPSVSSNPSSAPSDAPSVSTSPSKSPSGSSTPSSMPSDSPSLSTNPSSEPSNSPSLSISPSKSPSGSINPSSMPSDSPSLSTNPSSEPSNSPSLSISPSKSPSGSINPSSMPSDSPSGSINPSSTPSKSPSLSTNPSSMPSAEPSSEPSDSPTLSISPSKSPSGSINPSSMPSDSPSLSINPSSTPSDSPSLSISPSKSPSGSIDPSSMPSDSPSLSTNPSSEPSMSPTLSISPSKSPSGSSNPSSEPSMSPSVSTNPSSVPSDSPSLSISPSASPSGSSNPSSMPSDSPSGSINPSTIPSDAPSLSISPSKSPSGSSNPSSIPSVNPSSAPSDSPSLSISPSKSPSGSSNPSSMPSDSPSVSTNPSSAPSKSPTLSISPSKSPSGSSNPSSMPSDSPSLSINPSSAPSDSPSLSISPSKSPSGSSNPSSMPSDSPSVSINPSSAPSKSPTLSISPSKSPSGSSNPSSMPSDSPSESTNPSNSPSANPSLVPSKSPSKSSEPSSSPTAMPMAGPSTSLSPSTTPSAFPSVLPSQSPTGMPLAGPSASINPSTTPSMKPSVVPSALPSQSPSKMPSRGPSLSMDPSVAPSALPSQSPSKLPSRGPSLSMDPSVTPSALPSLSPSSLPSKMPSSIPSLSIGPSAWPSKEPSALPSSSPSKMPSKGPSESMNPSVAPSALPSQSPSKMPSKGPSESMNPSLAPSALPSQPPSKMPSRVPSLSMNPSVAPSALPSQSPSKMPSKGPSESMNPSVAPSALPSQPPSKMPSRVPSLSMNPSVAPSALPSLSPSNLPSLSPSNLPSLSPSNIPSLSPSNMPSLPPSNMPSLSPSNMPSLPPSNLPSLPPSNMPSLSPSNMPSLPPSNMPSLSPSNMPSLPPSNLPSLPPSNLPSLSPSNLPSLPPSNLPSLSPSNLPSTAPSVSSSPNAEPGPGRLLEEKTLPTAVAFVTSQDFAGSEIGGSKSADAICQDLARKAGLRGHFMAWISDNMVGLASTRLGADEEYLYTSVDGEELLDTRVLRNGGSPTHHIRKDERGNLKTGFVWTGTLTDSDSVAVGATCENWGGDGNGNMKLKPVTGFANRGLVGFISSKKENLHTWSSWATRPCNERYPIYCFERPEE